MVQLKVPRFDTVNISVKNQYSFQSGDFFCITFYSTVSFVKYSTSVNTISICLYHCQRQILTISIEGGDFTEDDQQTQYENRALCVYESSEDKNIMVLSIRRESPYFVLPDVDTSGDSKVRNLLKITTLVANFAQKFHRTLILVREYFGLSGRDTKFVLPNAPLRGI